MTAFDLTVLRGKLPEDRYRPVVHLIELVMAHAAVQMDLQWARLCLTQIRQVEAAESLRGYTEEMGLLTESLFVNAIFYYTRAVHSKPTSRLSVGVEKKFTPEQKVVHRRLTKLRDQCLAHYGRGEISKDDFWVDDRVIYVPGDPEPIQYPFVRMNHHGLITAGLLDLLDTAGPAVVKARERLAQQLVHAIEVHAAHDGHFVEALEASGFDTLEFHGVVPP